MKLALELAVLFAALSSGFAMGDKPAVDETEFPVISPKEDSGNSLPVLAEVRQPPAKVPASRAARAEWQRRLEQKRLEMQRRGRGPIGNDETRRSDTETTSPKRKPTRRSKTSRGRNKSTKPSPKKRSEVTDSKKKKNTSKKPTPQKKPQPKQASRKPKTRIKPDSRTASASQKETGAKDATKGAAADLPVIVPMAVRVPSYAAVRSTIPFSRSEWEADPTYRHNGTMELMLGQLRDMVVYRYPPMAGPMAPGSGVTINNGRGQMPNYSFGGFGGVPFGFNPAFNGVIQSRGIINSFQTQGFIGRGAPVLP